MRKDSDGSADPGKCSVSEREPPTSSGLDVEEDVCAVIDLCVYILEQDKLRRGLSGMGGEYAEAETKKPTMQKEKEALLRKIIAEAQKTVQMRRWASHELR